MMVTFSKKDKMFYSASYRLITYSLGEYYKRRFLIFSIILLSSITYSQKFYCIEFDGNNDYINIGDVNNLGTSDFTLEAWFYINSSAGIGNKIVNKGCTTAGIPSNSGYALRANRDATTMVELQVGPYYGGQIRVQYFGIETQKWYHVAGVRKQNNYYLYLDGQLVAEETSDIVINVDTDIPLVIGAIYKGATPTNEFMNGRIDEVRIWNVARTQSEINANKDCAITSPQQNLIAAYNFDLKEGLIVKDLSGFGNDGSMLNGPVRICSEVAPVCEER